MINPLLAFACRRLLDNGLLVISTALGLLMTVTLVTAIPLYSEGISEFLLKLDLATPNADRLQSRSSVLLSHFRYYRGGVSPPTSIAQYEEADVVFSEHLPTWIGLPELRQVSFLQTARMPLLPLGGDRATRLRQLLGYGFFFTAPDIQDNVELIEGRVPASEVVQISDGSGEQMMMIEVMMTDDAIDKLGLVVGDQFKVLYRDRDRNTRTKFENPIGVTIVGRFIPTDPRSTYWIYNAETTFGDGGMYINRDIYLDKLVERFPGIFYEASWYSDFDAEAIRASNYKEVIGNLETLRFNANKILPDTKLVVSPEDTLYRFSQKLFFLKLILFILGAPIVAIVLYYISLSSSMAVERQRKEIAILKSRGVGASQIVGIYVLEGLMIGAVAMIAGPFLATHVAQIIGKTYTFLIFTNREELRITLSAQHYLFAALAVALSIAATLGPAISAARQSIITHEQAVSRTTRRPLYQRFFLDFMLLAIAMYGYATIRRRDSLLTFGPEDELFSDPLLLIAPVIFIFAVALVFLRFFPVVVSVIAAVGARFYGVGVHLGLRQMGRSPGQFIRLVFLLILTFAIGTFSASMAATVDRNISDRILFKVGADAFFAESGIWLVDVESWQITPAERHYDLLDESGKPEIQQLARLWNTHANYQPPGQGKTETLTVFGVDPIAFANTVWWRKDFSSSSLNELMNSLALDERAILVDKAYFHDQLLLNIGDPLRMNLGMPYYLPDDLLLEAATGGRYGERQYFKFGRDQLEFTIAGWIDTFPTHYPEDGPFVVTNVNYIHRSSGESPWDIIATLGPDDSAGDLSNRLRALGIDVVSVMDFTGELLKIRNDATQIGTFGILTVGFLISMVLTLLGFLTYSFLSFHRRLQEFGILRAMGLSTRQMITLFIFENGFPIFLGTAVGTVLGILAGTLFIPFLQLSVDQFASTPPFIVEVGWRDIARVFVIFGVVVAITLPVSVWMLRRIQIHEAMKFGGE